MRAQPEIDPVPDIGDLGVMVDPLGIEGHPGQETECLVEIVELEGAEQRLAAVFQRPAVRNVHRDSPVLQPRYSLKARSMTSFQGLGTRERRRVLRARAAHARVGSLRLLRLLRLLR